MTAFLVKKHKYIYLCIIYGRHLKDGSVRVEERTERNLQKHFWINHM